MTTTLPVKAIDAALAVVADYDRPDLEVRLRQARVRLLDDRVRVLVVGEFKQGKSSLVNGLVEAAVCPVHDDIATAVPTVVRNASTPTVTLVRPADAPVHPAQRRIEYHGVPEPDLWQYVWPASDPRERFSHVEVGLPRRLLSGGLEIVDTPGVGGLNSVHGAATMAALPSAHAVLLVSDASQEYTATELEFLRRALQVCPNVACVLTKTDLYPEWRRVAELNAGHLAGCGIRTDILAVSSAVRAEASRRRDPRLDGESGFPALVRYLRHHAVAEADLLARRLAVHDIVGVLDQLIGSLEAERDARRNPEAVRELIARLTAARERSAALKERSARWQQTLHDGVADLNADVDHDLRDRMREITRTIEDEIDASRDPAKIWDQICRSTEQQAADATSANFLWATERARRLAEKVSEHFAEERAAALPVLEFTGSTALQSVRAMTLRDEERWTLGQKALTGLKGGYIGVLMFGLLGTFAGLSLLNPFSVGAGLLLGGKTISDERKRVISRRRHEARQAVRRYVDDAVFRVGKDCRDMLRRVQRDLRDHFTELAAQVERSMQESLRAAEQSVTQGEAERKRRLAEIDTELERLEKLRQAARGLANEPRGDAPEKQVGEHAKIPQQRKAPEEKVPEPTR